MDLGDALLTTRAMRRLSNDPPVTAGEIEHCLTAAVQAPSGGNVQPWKFVVVWSDEQRAAVAEIYRRATERYLRALTTAVPTMKGSRMMELTQYLADHLHEVPSVAFVMTPYDQMVDDQGPLDIGTVHASVLPAVQNFMLAARGMGLGTTLTTVFRVYHDEMKDLLGVRSHHEIVALVPIGRPLGTFGVAPRRPAEEVTGWDTVQNRRPFG
ncbi:MAG TPA: nitroreductase family protein [Acidimicrobiales bacterium]|nr:nitroreductase family protein [Acidimicrobiales bacterium]